MSCLYIYTYKAKVNFHRNGIISFCFNTQFSCYLRSKEPPWEIRPINMKKKRKRKYRQRDREKNVARYISFIARDKKTYIYSYIY